MPKFTRDGNILEILTSLVGDVHATHHSHGVKLPDLRAIAFYAPGLCILERAGEARPDPGDAAA